jgi:hypothetical protein
VNDTSSEIRALVHDRLMQRSGEERMIMGSASFDAAREIMIASLPTGLSAIEFRKRLFERIYGNSDPELTAFFKAHLEA